MEQKGLNVVCAVAGFLGLLSVILGFAAEGSRIKDSEVHVFYTTCTYPSSPSMGLALSASIILLVAEIIIAVGSGCCGCCMANDNTSRNRALGIIFSVISWIAAVVAIILFIAGAAANGPGSHTNTSCTVVKPGIFAGGSVLSFVAVVLGIGSVISLGSSSSGVQYGGHGISMAQPQYPNQSNIPQPPVYANSYPGQQPQFAPR